MAYITGASADINTLLTAIKTFAVACGWTAHVTDSYTLAFTTYSSSNYVAHNNNRTLLQGLGGSDAYDNRGETSTVATRTVLSKGSATYQLLAYHKTLQKNGILGTYAVLEVWACDGYTANANANLQANNRKFGLIGPLSTSLYAYHLFSAGDYIHLVVEETPGRFRHLSFGMINKYADFPGGQYLTSGNPYESETTTPYSFNADTHLVPFGANGFSSHRANLATYAQGITAIRADIDGWTAGWRAISYDYWDSANLDAYGCATYGNTTNNRAGYIGSATQNSFNSLAHDLAYHCSPQNYNGLAPMLPCYVGVNRTPYVGTWTLLGEFPDVRFLNISNFTPGDELTLGTDVWKIFPLWNKAYTVGAEPISYDYGLAYRKVT